MWLNRAHQGAFFVLLGLLLWAPVPLGSNRGWALALLSLALCALLLFVLATAWWAGVHPWHPSASQPRNHQPLWPLLLPGAYVLLVAAQLLPLGGGPVSVDPFGTWTYLLASLGYLAGFALVLLLARSEERIRALMLTLVAGGVLQAGLAALLLHRREGYSYFFLEFPAVDRATGTFASPDHLAGYLLLSLAAGLGLMLTSATSSQRTAEGWRGSVVRALQFMMSGKMLVRLLLVAMVIALVLTRSRGGNGAFFIALTLTGALVAWRSVQLRKLALIVVTSMLVVDVFVIGQWVGLEKVVARLEATRVTVQQAEARQEALEARGLNLGREESLQERLYAAGYATQMLRERPLLGFGGGTFYIAFPRFKGEHPLGFYDHAHNDYVEIAANTGLLGLGLLLALGAAAFWRAVRALDDEHPALARGMAAAVVMATLSLGLHSMVDFNLQIPANALTLTCILALAWCLPVRSRRRNGKGKGSHGGSRGNGQEGPAGE